MIGKILSFFKHKDPPEPEAIPDFTNIVNATDTIGTESLPLTKIHICDLVCPTGQIVGADPISEPNFRPYTKQVQPGTYPVELYSVTTEIGGQRVAFATIKFSNNPPIAWEHAPIKKRDQYNQPFGFGVDSGMGCLMDLQTAQLYAEFIEGHEAKDPEWRVYDDHLCGVLMKNRNEGLHYQLPNQPTTNNIAMFCSGYGDGRYPAYWGFDQQNQPTHLIVDLFVIEPDSSS